MLISHILFILIGIIIIIYRLVTASGLCEAYVNSDKEDVKFYNKHSGIISFCSMIWWMFLLFADFSATTDVEKITEFACYSIFIIEIIISWNCSSKITKSKLNFGDPTQDDTNSNNNNNNDKGT